MPETDWKESYLSLQFAVAKFLVADGNDMCHENREALATAAGFRLVRRVGPLPFFRFLWNCLWYRVGLTRRCRNCKRGGQTCPSNRPT